MRSNTATTPWIADALTWLASIALLLAVSSPAATTQSQFEAADVHASAQRPDGRVSMMESIGGATARAAGLFSGSIY